MALTTNQLVVGMFNMAAGGYKTLVGDYMTANGATATADALLAASGLNPQFMGTNLYSNADFASALVGRVLSGVTSGIQSSISTIVSNYMTANPTMSRGAVVVAVLEAVLAVPTTDATLGTAVSSFTSKVALADASTSTSTDFTTLAAVVGSTSTTTTGQTFTLSTSVDNVTGTSGNDTVTGTLIGTAVGAGSTVNVADSINLGAGTDTAEIKTTAATAFTATILPTLTGVETLKLTSLSGATSLVGTLAPDMTTLDLNSYAGASAMTVTAASANLRTINISNSTQDVNDLTVTYSATGSSTSTDALTFNLNAVNATTDYDVADDALVAIEGAAAGADNGIEQLVFAVTGKNMLEAVTSKENNGGATALNKITVTGSGSLSIGTALAVDTAGVLTVDASANTGGVTMSVGTTKTAFTGGSGDDTVIFGTAGDLDANDSINLGTGNNTIIVADTAISSTTTALNAAINGVTTAGTVGFSAAVTGLDMGYLTASNVLSMNDVDLTMTKQSATDTLILKGANVANRDIAANGGLGYTTLNVKLVAADTVASTTKTFSADTISTLNIESTSDSTSLTNLTGVLTNAAAATITITGNGNIAIGDAAAGDALAASAVVNASALTGTLTAIASNTASSIQGGSGKDTITGGTGADTLVGGAGADTIDTGANLLNVAESITGGLGADIIALSGVLTGTYLIQATAAESYSNAVSTSTTNMDTYTFANAGATAVEAATFTTGVVSGQSGALTVTSTAVTLGTTTTTASGFVVYSADNATYFVYQDTDGDTILETGEFAVCIVGSDAETFAVTSGKLVATVTGA